MSGRMLEKLALPNVKEELPRLHASHAQMLPEEAETEYLKVNRPMWCIILGVSTTIRAPFSPIILERRQKHLWLISPKLDNSHQNYLN